MPFGIRHIVLNHPTPVIGNRTENLSGEPLISSGKPNPCIANVWGGTWFGGKEILQERESLQKAMRMSRGREAYPVRIRLIGKLCKIYRWRFWIYRVGSRVRNASFQVQISVSAGDLVSGYPSPNMYLRKMPYAASGKSPDAACAIGCTSEMCDDTTSCVRAGLDHRIRP